MLIFALPGSTFGSGKVDTVYLKNGDRITGELKRMEYGILFLKTSGLGTIKIEYDRIKTFYAKERYKIQLASGLKFFGSIDTSRTEGYVVLRVNEFRIPEPIEEIVEVYPVKNAFWKRLDGYVDLGYSYTKASTISQFNFAGEVSYRVKKAFSRITGSSILTDQEDRDRIRKQDYAITYQRFFKKHTFGALFTGVQQNTELGNQGRFYVGTGVGNNFVHNNLHILTGSVGALYSTEQSQSDTAIQSVEGGMFWTYRLFKFNNPDVEISSHFNTYPSFTTWGRVRLEFELKFKIELFSDFYFGLSFYDNYDNKPLDETAARNDWGVTTSIGYSW